jgi:hypothetical protein
MKIRSCLVSGFALMLLAAGPAGADGFMSAQVGGFAPWNGDAGPMTSFQILGSGASGKSRFGGEFEYRSFDSKITGIRNVDVDSYVIRGMWQYHIQPDAAFTPYFGLGIGVVISEVDDRKIDAIKGYNARDSVGAGLDAMFLLGISVKIPRTDYLSVFAEGRIVGAFDVAGRGRRDGVDVENVGGGSGSAGVRFRF